MRRARKPGRAHCRTTSAISSSASAERITVWLLRDRIFAAVGRDSDLTGREEIWQAVHREGPGAADGRAGDSRRPGTRAIPPSTRWIIDHGQTVDAGAQHVGRRLLPARHHRADPDGPDLPRLHLARLVLRRGPPALGSPRRPAVLRRCRCCPRSSAPSCSCRASPSPRPCCCGAGCSSSCSASRSSRRPTSGRDPPSSPSRSNAASLPSRRRDRRAPRARRGAGLGILRPRVHPHRLGRGVRRGR